MTNIEQDLSEMQNQLPARIQDRGRWNGRGGEEYRDPKWVAIRDGEEITE